MSSFRESEPLIIRGAVVAAVNALFGVLLSFGVPLTTEQIHSLDNLIDLGSIAALVVWTRGKVTPYTSDSSEEVIREVPEESESEYMESPRI